MWRKGSKTIRNNQKKFSSTVWEQDAAGSNPVTRTIFGQKNRLNRRFFCVFDLISVISASAVQK